MTTETVAMIDRERVLIWYFSSSTTNYSWEGPEPRWILISLYVTGEALIWHLRTRLIWIIGSDKARRRWKLEFREFEIPM